MQLVISLHNVMTDSAVASRC